MKPLHGLAVVLLAAAILTGCRREAELAPGAYRLRVEDVVAHPDSLVVRRVALTAQGRRTIKIAEGDAGSQVVTIEPENEGDPIEAQILLLANLPPPSPDGTLRQLTWLAQIHSPAGTVGGPAYIPVAEQQALPEAVNFAVQPGDYPLGQDLKIAEVQGRPIVLNVQ